MTLQDISPGVHLQSPGQAGLLQLSFVRRHRQLTSTIAVCTDVEFYLYPTVGTVLIHSVKPELTE